jgi:hypothetical protein
MDIRRLVAVCAVVAFVGHVSLSLNAQDKKPQAKKPTKQEQEDINSLVKLVDGIASGQPAPPADPTVKVTWTQNHFLKASDGKTFTPFTLRVEGLSPAVAMYVRAVKKGTAPPTDKDKNKRPDYAWDDVQFFDVPSNGMISRALSVPAGDYDLFVAVKEKSTGKKNEVNKTGVLRRDLSVPDFGKPELGTSSIILAKAVEPSQPLDAETQRANPYTFGNMKVTPVVDPTFAKGGELNLVFWIYGETPAAGQKPDVLVEYNFHQKTPQGEKYFNKTAPQALNASAVPPEFDLSVGHLLMGSLSVPLASFPPGDYRLEIKITDKPSGKSTTQNVAFSVTA